MYIMSRQDQGPLPLDGLARWAAAGIFCRTGSWRCSGAEVSGRPSAGGFPRRAVRGDILTDPSDVQAMFDNIPVADKKLHWIEGTTARWDGYLEFQRRPQPMLDWFARYL